MSRTEYKTVAMPQLVRGRRRRGQSRGEMIAETLSRVINEQGQAGWTYVGADHFRTIERPGFFRAAEEVVYTVLVFERTAVERRERVEPVLRSEPEPTRGRERDYEAPRSRDAEPKRGREPEQKRPRDPEPMRGRERDIEPARGRDPEMRPRGGGARRGDYVDEEPPQRRRPGDFVRRRQTYEDR